jgi:hypothetical protein
MTIAKLTQLRYLVLEPDLIDQRIEHYKKQITPEWPEDLAALCPVAVKLCKAWNAAANEQIEMLRDLRARVEAEVARCAECIRNAPDPLLRTIMTLRFFDGLSWDAISLQMRMGGGRSHEAAVRRYLKKYVAE